MEIGSAFEQQWGKRKVRLLLIKMLIFLIVVAAAIPPNLVEVTTANFESTFRRSSENWIYTLVEPKHDLQLLNLLSSLADVHPDYRFAYTDVST